MEQAGTRHTRAIIGVALGCLLTLGVVVSQLGAPLIVTMGIVVVAAGLFLTPRQTLIVAVAAVASAVAVAFAFDVENQLYRIGNVLLASALGLAASWALQQRVRRIEALRRTEEQVFASVPDALVVLDNAGVILQSNPSLTDIVPAAQVGMKLHPLLGHLRADGSACPGGCCLDDPTTVHLVDPPERVEGERIAADGSTRWVDYSCGRIDDERTVVSLRDVTALVTAEEYRRALLEAAARQQEQQALMSALGSPQHVSLPDVTGVEVDLWSTGADHGATSGDIVEVTELPDGRVLIIMVDARGTGVASIRDAWKVLYLTRAYLTSGVPLSDLVSRTAATLASESDPPRASVLAAVLDPQTGRVDLATGGHPPGLLLHADGTSQWLEATGRGVGAPSPGSQRVVTARLADADSLVLYTDGVVGGTRDFIEGLSNLKSSATALRRQATHGWARKLMAAVASPGTARDDATILLVRRTGQAGPSLQTSTTR